MALTVYNWISRSSAPDVLPMPFGRQEGQKPPRRLVGHAREPFKETSLAFVDSGLGGIIEQLRAGLSPSVIDVITKKLDMSVDSLLRELKLPRSTLKSRQVSGKKLSTLEAERMVRVARLFKRAVEVFEDEEDARNWLKRPLRALGGKSPLSFLDIGPGCDLVDAELKRIEYGIPS